MTTDFFNREARARKQTRLLLPLFGLAVLAVIVLNYLILVVPALTFCTLFAAGPLDFSQWIWNARFVFWFVLISLTSISLGCFYKIHLLAGGGSAVAELLGGRKIEDNPTDPKEKQLCDVVAEMAIASGLSVPEIYVLDCERGINTFAAGHTREDVAIGVIFGALKLLTRDELQGVIAHEFSHILNGDTRLNMKLMGLAHGLSWPTIIGRVLVRGPAQPLGEDDSIFDPDLDTVLLPTAPIGFMFLLMGSVSSPFVRLIKSLICREREWLADAAAVQFTRNPAGIESALKKIGGLLKQGRFDSPYAEIASHLYFTNSTFDPWFEFMSTHPPLASRILAIDPAFDGQFQHIRTLLLPEVAQAVAFDQKYEENVRRAREQARLREELE